TATYVSISGTANGVAGDTMGKGEVMDMDFFTTNPTGFTGLTPDAQVSSMFLKFDGIGNTEDFIVILKLYDPTTNEYTTKAMYVENADIFKGPGSGPGAYSSVTLDNNDGLLIIESNDYNAAGQHYVLVGAQITPTDEGISGTAINLNGAIGAGGASTTTQDISSDSNDLGFKISDIGLVSTTTTAQNADLTFNVTLKDADNDTTTAQQLDVHVTNGVTYTGTADAETMQGTANGDTLNGNGGDDILQGFGGNDLLIGGAGQDTLTGGTGADTFKLDHLDIKDLIVDYSGVGGEGDKIDLTALFDTAPGGGNIGNFVNYDAGTGTLSVDTSGSGNPANFVEVAQLTNHPAANTITLLYDDGTTTHTTTANVV
ncbi:type I secretion C-terminal target domain-containing protein, partial [Mesorhizobium sp. M4A.F.Ca.ET.029.04.2.1]